MAAASAGSKMAPDHPLYLTRACEADCGIGLSIGIYGHDALWAGRTDRSSLAFSSPSPVRDQMPLCVACPTDGIHMNLIISYSEIYE